MVLARQIQAQTANLPIDRYNNYDRLLNGDLLTTAHCSGKTPTQLVIVSPPTVYTNDITSIKGASYLREQTTTFSLRMRVCRSPAEVPEAH